MSTKTAKRSRKVPAKKVARACIHCRNAHITCDENRPCTRCIKKGLQDTCIDAPRKVKKYLLTADDTSTGAGDIGGFDGITNHPMVMSKSLPVMSSTMTSQYNVMNIPNINITSNTSPSRRELRTTGSTTNMSSGFIKPLTYPRSSIDENIEKSQLPLQIPIKLETPSSIQDDINFLSSAADSEYAILGNIIDQTLFTNNNNNNNNTANTAQVSMHNSSSTGGHPHNSKYLSPALSTGSDDFDYLNYQPLMTHNSNDNSPLLQSTIPSTKSIQSTRNESPFVKPLQPIEMSFKETDRKPTGSDVNDTSVSDNENNTIVNINGERKLKYSDLYPDQPLCDSNTNQYFLGTMSTIDGIKTHTFPEIVKRISKFKREYPKKFKERNKRCAISFSIGIIDDVIPEIENNTNNNGNNGNNETSTSSASSISTDDSFKCGLLYNEPSEIYEKIKQPFTYVKPYHDLNVYLKSRFSKQDLIQMSKSMTEYRPSFIAGMIRLKEDDLIFAEQCFQRTLLEYDSYIAISGTPTLVWRRSSQIAYVGDEFCILTGWSKDDLLSKSTFAVEIMDDKSCVEYFKLFSKIAFGDISGDIMTECTLLTPKNENIRTCCTWTLKRDVFGIPMMIIATFLPILT